MDEEIVPQRRGEAELETARRRERAHDGNRDQRVGRPSSQNARNARNLIEDSSHGMRFADSRGVEELHHRSQFIRTERIAR